MCDKTAAEGRGLVVLHGPYSVHLKMASNASWINLELKDQDEKQADAYNFRLAKDKQKSDDAVVAM